LGDVALSDARRTFGTDHEPPESRNAVKAALCSALADQLAYAAEDRGVRAVIITGTGGAFSVGGDVKTMNDGSGRDTPEAARRRLAGPHEASRLLHEMPKPTIAAIEGPAAAPARRSR
jgi:2-(1,2-epoxy-1,2-dihydrophenyl)acetyl-CoA isomerase